MLGRDVSLAEQQLKKRKKMLKLQQSLEQQKGKEGHPKLNDARTYNIRNADLVHEHAYTD